jgi:hypothetical protein
VSARSVPIVLCAKTQNPAKAAKSIEQIRNDFLRSFIRYA